jgi:hypothetical protein
LLFILPLHVRNIILDGLGEGSEVRRGRKIVIIAIGVPVLHKEDLRGRGHGLFRLGELDVWHASSVRLLYEKVDEGLLLGWRRELNLHRSRRGSFWRFHKDNLVFLVRFGRIWDDLGRLRR